MSNTLSLTLLALAAAMPVATFAEAPVRPVDPAARAEWRAQRQAQATERRAETRAAHAAQCPRADAMAACPSGPRWMHAGGGRHGMQATAYGTQRGLRLHEPGRRGTAPVAPAAPGAPVVAR